MAASALGGFDWDCAGAQVYALTKERDALRRNAERLNSANDLVREKDAIIQQVACSRRP
jgi:hypothetical protein